MIPASADADTRHAALSADASLCEAVLEKPVDEGLVTSPSIQMRVVVVRCKVFLQGLLIYSLYRVVIYEVVAIDRLSPK
jgi:hypothetical protein